MFVEAQFQFLMRQREEFHTAVCSGIYIHRDNQGLRSISQGTEVYCAMSIGCTAAYAAVTGRRYAAQ